MWLAINWFEGREIEEGLIEFVEKVFSVDEDLRKVEGGEEDREEKLGDKFLSVLINFLAF